jgi:hypothetical protein
MQILTFLETGKLVSHETMGIGNVHVFVEVMVHRELPYNKTYETIESRKRNRNSNGSKKLSNFIRT